MKGSRHRARSVILAVALVSLLSCGKCPTAEVGRPDRIAAFVSIPPQAYFLERVGGERVSVRVLVGPGQSPATYEPTPGQMAALEKGDVYFRIGVPFEKALLGKIKAAFTSLNVVDTREGIELRRMEGGRDRGEADRGARDPHIWTSPGLVKIQAGTMQRELARLDPANAKLYEGNLGAFETDLDRVDREIASVLAPLAGGELLVFHPAFGYFADAYGLKQVSVEVEGKAPGARYLARTIERAKESGAKVIFVQPEFAAASAGAIAEAIGGAVVPLDPLARDYLSNLKEIARRIEDGMGGRERVSGIPPSPRLRRAGGCRE